MLASLLYHYYHIHLVIVLSDNGIVVIYLIYISRLAFGDLGAVIHDRVVWKRIINEVLTNHREFEGF